MPKLNCWESQRCGREPGGRRVAALGLCPAATTTEVEGINHGRAGGRVCWAIAGTFCGGGVQGTAAQKGESCMSCEFFRTVVREEGRNIASGQAVRDALGVLDATGSD